MCRHWPQYEQTTYSLAGMLIYHEMENKHTKTVKTKVKEALKLNEFMNRINSDGHTFEVLVNFI